MQSSWAPNFEELSQICTLLHALRDPSRSDHSQAMTALNTYIQNPSFVLNLIFVFGYGNQVDSKLGLTPELRQLSGFVIKNYVFQHLNVLDTHVQHSIKEGLLLACKDSILVIRTTACILLGRIIEAFPVEMWGNDVLPVLFQRLDPINLYSTEPFAVDGAMHTIKMICEDSSEKLSMDTIRRPLDTLVPKLISMLSCPDPKIRQRAIESMNSMLFLVAPATSTTAPSSNNSSNHSGTNSLSISPAAMENKHVISSQGNASEAIFLNMQPFLRGISVLSVDNDSGVRKVVCQSIVLIASMFLSVLEPIYDSICQFMLNAILDADESVSCEACEFWYTMAQNVQDGIAPHTSMTVYFERLIPNLISRMILTEDKIMQDRLDEEAEASGEKRLNIRPLFGTRSHQMSRQEQQDRAEEEDELSEEQTIRKQAAVVLDTLGLIFPSEDLLKLALPMIQIKLSSSNEWERESGLLALGALSNGCESALSPYTPNFLPFLLASLQEKTPELRSIACWVLSRYCGWFFEDQQLENGLGKDWYLKSLHSLLQCLSDPKSKVQSSAISALIVLFDKVPDESYAIPYLPEIFTLFHQVFPVYGVKSKIMLIDVIGCIATLVGEEGMSNSSLTPLYFPYIFDLLNSVEDNDMRLYPIMECLVCVLAVISLESQPYIITIYQRFLRLLDRAMSTTNGDNNKPTPHDEPPPKELAICALDGISSISAAYKTNFSLVIDSTQVGGINTLLTVIFSSLHDPMPPLRQSGFSVVGELFKHGPISLLLDEHQSPLQPNGLINNQPSVSGIYNLLFDLLLQNLNHDYPMVFNNSAWAIGELVIRLVKHFNIPCPVNGHSPNGVSNNNPFIIEGYLIEYLPRICHGLIVGMQDYEADETLQQNIAITWGILCRYLTRYMVDATDEVFQDWCLILKIIPSSSERDQAFLGLITILYAKPSLLLSNVTGPSSTSSKNISSFIDACASWEEPPDESLQLHLHRILDSIRVNTSNSSSWRVAMQLLNAEQKQQLFDNFRLNA